MAAGRPLSYAQIARPRFQSQQSKMVARDGIEPPTPAFSGPRSTTELPGLGMVVRLIRDSQVSSGAGGGMRRTKNAAQVPAS